MTKRLIVCCDGTWNDPDNDTNVFRAAERAVLKTRLVHSDGSASEGERKPKREQIVYYDSGVGTRERQRTWGETFASFHSFKDWATERSPVRRLLGGAFGAGLSENIMQAYRFLSRTCEHGDEIYLIGYSRGAYSVRSLCGFLNSAWLLPRDQVGEHEDPGLDEPLLQAYQYYRTAHDQREFHPYHTLKTKLGRRVLVRFVGVYDTVGALGIPAGWAERFNRRYAFHDTALCGNALVCRQALAIDEQRGPFAPTLWTGEPATIETPEGPRRQDVRQVWFPGVHGNVGGGWKDDDRLQGLALRWLMSEAVRAGLEADLGYLRDEVRADPLGRLNDSMTSFWRRMHRLRLLPAHQRQIGLGLEEYLHHSVRERLGASDAIGPNGEKGPWAPVNLTKESRRFRPPFQKTDFVDDWSDADPADRAA